MTGELVSEQLTFGFETAPARRRTGLELRYPGWTRVSAAKAGKCNTHWRHDSGWEVRHCGHPTALYPYTATHPDVDRTVVSNAGVGFVDLEQAFDEIGLLLAGTAKLDHGQGNRGNVRRIRVAGDEHWVPLDDRPRGPDGIARRRRR